MTHSPLLDIEQLSQKPHSVKIETDQKCVKVSVDIYGDDAMKAGVEAINVWLSVTEQLKAKGFVVAPL